jgi:hypothetical protein
MARPLDAPAAAQLSDQTGVLPSCRSPCDGTFQHVAGLVGGLLQLELAKPHLVGLRAVAKAEPEQDRKQPERPQPH